MTSGCIQMEQRDIEELYSMVKVGTTVYIDGGDLGPFDTGVRRIKPGDRGADVYEVQKRMQSQGYYSEILDGIYGEPMKACVAKFRENYNLIESEEIDEDFYKALGIEFLQ